MAAGSPALSNLRTKPPGSRVEWAQVRRRFSVGWTRSAVGGAAGDVAEGDIAVEGALAGRSQDALAHHVAGHLGGSAADAAHLAHEEVAAQAAGEIGRASCRERVCQYV